VWDMVTTMKEFHNLANDYAVLELLGALVNGVCPLAAKITSDALTPNATTIVHASPSTGKSRILREVAKALTMLMRDRDTDNLNHPPSGDKDDTASSGGGKGKKGRAGRGGRRRRRWRQRGVFTVGNIAENHCQQSLRKNGSWLSSDCC